MSSSYTTNKNIEKPAYNDYATNATGWSGPINTDWDIIDRSLGGIQVKNPTGVSGTVNLTVVECQPPIIVIGTSTTGVATLTANVTYLIPSGVGGVWTIYNNTTGAFTVTFGSAGGGTSVVLSQGFHSTIYSDGTNVKYADDRIPSAAGSDRQVQFNSGGFLGASSGLTYNSQGNLGLGGSNTSDTTYTWMINAGPSTTNGGAFRTQTSDAASVGTFFTNNLAAYIGSDTNTPFIFRSNSVEVMRITPALRLKIGTTAYDSCKLAIAVPQSAPQNVIEAHFTGSGSVNATCYIASADAGATNFDFFGAYVGSSKYAAIDGSGSMYLRGTASVNTGAVTGGEALSIRNGGDFFIYAANNTDHIGIYCDTAGKLNVDGIVKSNSGGFQFPDNTVQTTAATTPAQATSWSSTGKSANTTYTNGASFTITVFVSMLYTGFGGGFEVFVNGLSIGQGGGNQAYKYGECITFPVPAGATYRVNMTNLYAGTWAEFS
jgi:hypothetical protein